VHTAASPAAVLVKRLPANAAGYAREIYAALRELEDADCKTILIEQVPEGPEWAALRDRLERAAAPA
jgi:L-threonylcarbamoyladenylate synthase